MQWFLAANKKNGKLNIDALSRLLFGFFLLGLANLQLLSANTIEDAGRHFTIKTDSPTLSGKLLSLCTNAAQMVESRLGFNGDWRLPIRVRFDFVDEPRSMLTRTAVGMYQLPSGYVFQIVLRGNTTIVPRMIETEVIRAMLLDIALQNPKNRRAKDFNHLVPRWLQVGLTALLHPEGREDERQLLQLLIDYGRQPKLSYLLENTSDYGIDIFQTIDSGTSRILLEALINFSNGKQRLVNYLIQGGELKEHFPELTTTSKGMEQWWAVQLVAGVRIGTSEIFLSPIDTEKKLSELLFFLHPEKEPEQKRKFFFKKKKTTELKKVKLIQTHLRDYKEIIGRTDQRSIFTSNIPSLKLLHSQACPTYRPIIEDYIELFQNMAQQKNRKNYDKKIARLEKSRGIFQLIHVDITNAMNAYEFEFTTPVTSADDNLFFFKEAKQNDPYSAYLDDFEKSIEPNISQPKIKK